MGSSSARKKVLASQIVAKAARQVAVNSGKFPHLEHHSCSSISLQASLLAPHHVAATLGWQLRLRYGNLFSPMVDPPYLWLDDRFMKKKDIFKTLQERNEWRITALCLFSAILEAEEAEEKEAVKKSRVKRRLKAE